ncbi:2-haloacid dehalogenase [Cohaesibacter sp. ES.047]|uniref:haloacid dehalogenase type II n=1 Tax=Cohaesibacter sp. ES.047 TaxID=1798205 RepID=UPI000BC02B99|nr:haloacid dehalogenase type II [Cohaesibacter sp. ES.047]SNY92758.1 2-haloacid dehalogenase [Cohaesibacter sp. ES.047]
MAPTMTTPSTVYVFDAYGTLFDVHAAVRLHAGHLGPDAARLSGIWRAKQLEYSWTRSLMHQYLDFWTLTEQALDFAFEKMPHVDRAIRPDLLDAYRTLSVYQEVRPVLEGLKGRGMQLAILSNGSPAMLNAAVAGNGLEGLFDEILSVDPLRTYKTSKEAYDLVTTTFRCFPDTVSFQSSNRWDIAGAAAYGFRATWINRDGVPDEYRDLAPMAQFKDLKGLLTY